MRIATAARVVAAGALCLGLGATTGLARPQEARALALAVASFEDAWQTINDTFYDPAFGGVDWPAVRRELLPRVRAAKSPDEVRALIREMIARLGQSHFELISDSTALPGAASVPIEIRILRPDVVITRVMGDGAAARAGLRPGQILLALDGVSTDVWRKAATGKDDRARDLDHWEAAYRALHGADGARAVLRVRESDGREREVTVARHMGSRPLLQFGNILMKDATLESRRARTPGGKDVGVIAFTLWMTAVSEPFARAVDEYRGAAGIVIDLRGNPGGLAQMNGGFSGHFIPEPVVLGTMRTRAAPLEFRNNPRFSTDDGRRVQPFAGPVAILVDEQTASASETFSGALQSLGRARIFGRQTMGQALPASTHTLPNGDVLLHAMGDFVTSTGKHLEGGGVVPDEIVPLSIPALAAGRDGALEAALSWIDRARVLLLCSVDPHDRVFLPRCDAPDAPLKQARPEDRGRVARRSTGSSVGSY